MKKKNLDEREKGSNLTVLLPKSLNQHIIKSKGTQRCHEMFDFTAFAKRMCNQKYAYLNICNKGPFRDLDQYPLKKP